ncbi:hypothetical protein K461DRAFT_272753 [Myriangium duriaei CBS 260.36]|uniref:Zinc finger RING-type eukaryotic domain-containing protein n=1 Tax=Myriangium duriaei CBS 260.36 TaxID=1168546 RepID=A0A9P4MKW6_9PEZI|nr:hypothetical protein K461DRAFT_272753 [Myriangium duriaei CBS 260.36]
MESGNSSSVQSVYDLAPSSRGIKRSHAQMAESHHPPQPFFTHATESPSQPRSNLLLPPLVPAIRSPVGMPPPPLADPHRRGLDYRRPIVNHLPNVADVVDLTTEDDEVDDDEDEEDTGVHAFNRPNQPSHQRLPRFGRSIIDLSGESSPPQPPQHEARRTPYREDRVTPSLRRESSSDVAFINQRRRDRQQLPGLDPPTPSPPRRRQVYQTEIDLTNTSDPDPDDVIFVESRRNPNPQPPVRPRGREHLQSVDFDEFEDAWFNSDPPSDEAESSYTGSRLLRSMNAGMHGMHAILGQGFSSTAEFARRFGFGSHTMAPGATARVTFAQPMMNYSSTGFDLGITVDDDPPRQPSYQPPPPPEDGFTRTPSKAETVVCPACGDELAKGATDQKMQVWVVKTCGHVYCGQCIANRSKSKAKQGKARLLDAAAPPTRFFSECVVDGCKSNVKNKTAVCQIFL